MKSKFLAPLIVALAAALAPASPVKGPIHGRIALPSAVDVECLANQPTAAMAMGDHLEIVVYEIDARGEPGPVVARDQAARNLVGVVWIPPRTAKYRVVIQNSSAPDGGGACYRSIK